jgi:hypothetical protein
MADNWNETPEYRAAHGEYVQKMTTAVADQNPEVAKLQADNWWLGRQAEIRDAHYQVSTARSALETAVVQAKATRPDVPEAVWAIAQTPETLQALLTALPPPQTAPPPKAPQRPARPAAAVQPTGGPPPSATSAPSSEEPGWGDSGRRWFDREYLQKLIDNANDHSGDGAGRPSKYVEEFIDLFMDNRVFTQMGFNPDGTSAI